MKVYLFNIGEILSKNIIAYILQIFLIIKGPYDDYILIPRVQPEVVCF